jgi:hypothetical protein
MERFNNGKSPSNHQPGSKRGGFRVVCHRRGGIAALFYIEPIVTFDLDIFIILPSAYETILSLSPIYSWFEKHGYKPDKEHIILEGVTVQFIPAYNDLVKESVQFAVEKSYGDIAVRVLSPEYLVAIMLQTFWPKDKERILRFLQEASLEDSLLESILRKHHLENAFQNFKERYYGI